MTEAAEILAREFHRHFERLAPHFGCDTPDEMEVPWDHAPEPNKSLLLAVARALVESGVQVPEPRPVEMDDPSAW